MEENKISELMDVTMTKLRQLADTNTIVGSPITTPDGITVIPVSRISFGFGTAGASGGGAKGVKFTGGNGAGVKVEPIGFLVVKDGSLPHDQCGAASWHHHRPGGRNGAGCSGQDRVHAEQEQNRKGIICPLPRQ